MNILISGKSGAGKSYFFENKVYPIFRDSHPHIIIDPKNQYQNFCKNRKGWVTGHVHSVTALQGKLKTAWLLHRPFAIVYVDEYPDTATFDEISDIIYKMGNCVFVVEECHLYLKNKWNIPRKFDRLMRMGTGPHNRNIDVILITQFPNDLNNDLFGNIHEHYMFAQNQRMLENMYTRGIIDRIPKFKEKKEVTPKGYVGQGYKVL